MSTDSTAVAVGGGPKVSDRVLLELPCPGSDGCFSENPYKVDSATIYHVERDFTSGNLREYNFNTYQSDKILKAKEAEEAACASPTAANIERAKRLRAEATSSSNSNTFYYNEAKPVKVVGTSGFPAWLSTDQDNALISRTTEDDDGNPVYGRFYYEWDSTGQREGDYFVCWTWTPLPAGDSLTSHTQFYLSGNLVATSSIPTHYTVPEKYEVLLERYLPEMFKMQMSDDDRSPDILEKFNNAVAAGFTGLEDLANQIVDLMDGNTTHELFLPLLSNLFGLKLKTNDPTLWRRQIKNAVRLFKKKGTKKGLTEALDQAGMKLAKLTRLWQVASSYTWQESFEVDGTVESWDLEKVALGLDQDNFGLWLRAVDSEEYVALSSDYVSFETTDGVTTMTWQGSTLSVNPVDLVKGDIVRVMYLYNLIPDTTAQTLENYVRDLPTADQRDERDQDYPPKNWNVKVIEEDDPLLPLVAPSRYPYQNPIIFGQIRTTFSYSENAYNKDEYNGSLRDSTNPCDIDKNFLDSCTACMGSKFNVDIEIDNLSNDRIIEAQDVIREFSPGHAVLHTLNFTGGMNEFIRSPVETVEILMTYSGGDFVVSGEGQTWFNRAMKKGKTTQKVLRSQLADSTLVDSGSGTGYNEEVIIFCPEVEFNRIGMATDGSSELVVLSPSPNAGTTNLSDPEKHTAVVSSASEPLNTAAFTFRVQNVVTEGTLCDIVQDNLFLFSADAVDFGLLGVKSQWDVDNGGAAGAYTVLISAYSATPYTILDVKPDGTLVIADAGRTLPAVTTTDVTYQLRKNDGTAVLNGINGKITVVDRGRIVCLHSSVQDVKNLFKIGMYLYVSNTGNEHKITEFVPDTDDRFYIENYSDGDVSGMDLKVLKRLVDNQIGYFGYKGIKLKVTGSDLETSLGIQNGANSLVAEDNRIETDPFKEDFLVVIDGVYYFINEIDGSGGNTTITLGGPGSTWNTLSAGGTALNYDIYRYEKQSVNIPGQQFDRPAHEFSSLDRAGREIVIGDVKMEDGTTDTVTAQGGSEVAEVVSQTESVSFNIEYLDGTQQPGKL